MRDGRHFPDDIFRYTYLNEKEFKNVLEVYSLKSDWPKSNFGSDDGLAPNRRQVIIWTNGVIVYWRMLCMRHSVSMS